MTAQATPFRRHIDQPTAPSAAPVPPGNVVAMVVVGTALAVIASVTLRPVIPMAWVNMVLAAAIAVAGLSMWKTVREFPEEEALAWTPIAYAVVAAAIGQMVWATIGGIFSFGVGAPAASDVFSIAFYVLASLGLLRLPFVRSSRIGTFRMAMDVLVGMIAAATVLWELQEGVFDDGFVAPLLHLVLIASMLIALLRRSPYLFDGRLTLLLAGLAPTVLITELGPGVGSGASTVLWALTAVCLGLLATQLRTPQPRQSLILARPGRKRLVVPYLPVVGVALLFAVRVVQGADLSSGLLPWGMLAVMVGVVARSWAAVRENRQLVALERDQLLASLSHDIRTPLTVVSGFSEVLAGSWDVLSEPERREMVDLVRTGSASLAGIVSDLAALARSELDAIPLNLTRLEGKKLIADAIRRVFNLDGPLPIRAEVEPYLEVIGDHQRLVQVLEALFENAVRYGNGKILVVAKRSSNGRIMEVHDNGVGVAARHERIIWERFERGAHELNANVPGSGLGLAVVRSIVRAHGGDAWYRHSERLGGACFVIELPYDSSQALRRPEDG
jgi:signal transduction histidine kinase